MFIERNLNVFIISEIKAVNPKAKRRRSVADARDRAL